MNPRKLASGGVLLLIVGAVLLLVIGQAIGQPILLGFVETGSMEPTMEPNDGFVAVPPSIAGDIGPGDVITFDAQEIQGGGLTTHRVVDVTDEGYITRGDANPFTDQDGDEPIVTESQVVAVAWQPGEDALVIPRLGVAVGAMRGVLGALAGVISGIPGLGGLAAGNLGSVMVAIGALLLGSSFVTDVASGNQRRRRDTTRRTGYMRASVLLAIILFLVLIPTTASMVMVSGTMEMGIVSSQSPSDDPTVIGVGQSEEIPYELANGGIIPQVSVIESASHGVTIDDGIRRLSREESTEVHVTIQAPEETGFYLRAISEWHYPHVLPADLILAMHRIHPFVAVLGIDLFLAVIVTGLYAVSLGFAPVRMDSRGRDVPLRMRIQRWLNRFR